MTLFDAAHRLVGEIAERPGEQHHPFIQWCHEATIGTGISDETPWCSSFINRLAWVFRLPRTKKANARSWLAIGTPVPLADAKVGWDVVILKRGAGEQPGPEVVDAPGHVGLFAGLDGDKVRVLGGNQGNNVTIAPFPVAQVLGVRRLYSPTV